ncbi:MAG TPA: hypothetical protein VGV59_04780 [Pyrinomonadaceae bacterium]|nr:hypothetical protein [Pyrinomonadaceae bacterium]
MAEERNVGLARAPEVETNTATDATETKEELQRRMEQARESITQTVSEIKDTVANQYQQVRDNISETLDWREQYRRRPLAFSLGAAGVGLLLGYSIAGAFAGGADEDDIRESLYDEDDAYDVDERGGILSSASRSYAAQPILGGHDSRATASTRPQGLMQNAPQTAYDATTGGGAGYAYSSETAASSPAEARGTGDVGPAPRPSYSSGYESQAGATGSSALVPTPTQSEPQEPSGPGLLERFKGTRAYDRLQDELSTLGDRVIEELSKTAQTVVVPALLGKLKDLVGIDLSTQREVAQRTKLEQETARAGAGVSHATNQSQSAGQTAGSAGAGGGGTSL